ncbi:MAG: hypothetical protein IJQ01_00395 [Selenomonadaceae bacterium]|nr:hypothetical protein [Selenomonadaceae bacterium]
MLKRLFIAAIVCLLVISSQIVHAEEQIDWNSVPQFNTKAEVAAYIENGRRQGQMDFYFVLTSVKISTDKEKGIKEILALNEEFINEIALAPIGNLSGEYGTSHFLYEIVMEYPGNRVANAYLSGNTQGLTADEMQLYNVAVSIANEANRLSSPLEKELYIYKELCNRGTYYDEKDMFNADDTPKRFTTAFGALIDGKTNCSGFADAFYMLGRMCGLNVGRIGGYIKENGKPVRHGWNTITFDDVKTYCVDVTNGSSMKNLYLFNAPLKIMKNTHRCNWRLIPNLQRDIDERYGEKLQAQ